MKTNVTFPAFLASSFIFGALLVLSAQAQVLDASKITCEDCVFYKVSNPAAIVHWLSGYYHGKQNDPIVDPQIFQANVDKLRSFCEQPKNYKVPLMQVIEQTIDTKK
jgi:hypothetical protein